MIITIDGPVATGKSTISQKLAEALGFTFFDTGAMYRAITLGIMENKIDIDDPEGLSRYLSHFPFKVETIEGKKRYFIGEKEITESIRSLAVTSFVSKVSAIPQVREKLVALQRACVAEGVNAIFEGRDMGTVVFPNADLKIYLIGSPEVRAQRRYDEILRKNPEEAKTLTLERVLEDLHRRDAYDSSRAHSPLRPASDAYQIDTSNLTLDQVVEKIIEFKVMKEKNRK